jgi:putative hydrolase
MRIEIDTHTHTVASGHAYSTVWELALGARRRRLAGFVLTDHGPGLSGGTHPYHFGNLHVIPHKLRGVRFYRGIEANIMDLEGGLDLDDGRLAKLDFAYAGFHEACFPPRGEAENTEAMIAALANPMVDAISHPGNPSFPVAIREVVREAKARGKAIEINDSSFRIRKGSAERCAEFARACAEEGALVVCGSDAHFWKDVGRLDTAIALIKGAGIGREQVVNATRASFEAFVARRSAEKLAALG